MKTKSYYLTLALATLFAVGTVALTGCGNTSNKKSTEHQHEAMEEEHQHDMDEQHEHGDMDEQHEHGDMDEQHVHGDMDEQYVQGDMDEQHVQGDMAEAHYQCPMKCEGDKTYNEPGNCPVCKMDLKKKDHDHQE